MRYYPTDLLLAVEDAELALRAPESDLSRLLADAGLSVLSGLFAAAALAEGLDELFGGLSQYPWQPLVDSDDVNELSPAGAVVLTDHRAGNTLRGLLLGWAAGNDVTIRTARRQFWPALVDLLRRPGHPLPPARVVGEADRIDGHHIEVPDLVPVLPLDATEAAVGWGDAALFAPADGAGANAVRIRVDAGRVGDGDRLTGDVLALDCRSAWSQRLVRREYLMGTRLFVARSRDTAQEAGRLGAKLRYLVRRARHTPYYRDLPAVSGLADLHRLPVLDKESLEAHSLPASRDLCSDAPPSGEVLRSGATAGEPRYIVYSRTDWSNMVREAIPLFYALGVRPGDRLINALFGGSLYGGMITTVCEFSRMPIETYTTGQTITVDMLLMLCDRFSANVILGVPALIMPLLREAKDRRPDLRLEKVLYGATPMTESDKKWLRRHLGTEVISSVLAANDGAQLGYQCTELGGTLHHVTADYNIIEVVDEDGAPVPAGEPGHLLVTSLQKFEGPLIRYQIGDYGRIFAHDCACGVSGSVLEYLGRSDGLIRVKAREHLLYSDVLAALADFQVSQLQVEIITSDSKEIVVLRTESPLELDPDRVREHLVRTFEVLSDVARFDDKSLEFKFVVECHAEGDLPRNPTSGKIRPVIDRRLVAA